ncbi:carbohydrate ABC transporter permease [Haploplasma axanthum]|uniref:Inner membrane ABC transporter permease protein ycjP n=1 Tax=Haploplasma axanthum TaxID=29552 RepID=A0A449BBI6_HAPAX|nr:carbohydrate ABC transporter permease [Haploplasma axanthum]VEU79769.1 Inner membrane ABC transporter permease protein ycjP [Haploplasma axanthum]
MMKNKASEVFYSLREKTKTTKKQITDPKKRKVLLNKGNDLFVTILKYVLLYGLAFIIIFPLIQQLAIALREPGDINNPLVLWIPEKFSFKNFQIAYIVLDYGKSFINSVVLSTVVTFFQLIMATLVGYALARLKFPGHKIVFGLVVFTIVVAPTTLELPLKISLSNFWGTGINLLGSPTILFIFALTGMGIKGGIFIYLFRQFFKGIPIEIEESAMIDGANPFQVFLRIMLPNAMGGIILTTVLTFVWQWNDTYFTTVYVSKINATYETLTTKIMGISGNIQSAIQQAGVWELFDQDVTKNPLFTAMILNTAAILTMIPILVFYLIVQKRLFTEGVERSGLVG